MARVLVATDGSELAVAAGAEALRLLGSGHAYTLLTVLPPPGAPLLAEGDAAVAGVAGVGAGGLGAVPTYDSQVAEDEARALEREGRDILERTADGFGGELPAGAQRELRYGDAGPAICEVAADVGADVVVVGSHGSGFVRRVLVGSVSQHVVHHSPCPVLVVRQRDQDGTGSASE
ncbi:MAG: universal stress protein [Actinobacteria bacterium]|nr:universal stress protein [Actinomycetota bacterium]